MQVTPSVNRPCRLCRLAIADGRFGTKIEHAPIAGLAVNAELNFAFWRAEPRDGTCTRVGVKYKSTVSPLMSHFPSTGRFIRPNSASSLFSKCRFDNV